jgi:hypothetical protein
MLLNGCTKIKFPSEVLTEEAMKIFVLYSTASRKPE